MASDDITFPLPEKKYSGKCFFSSSVIHAQKMYNMLPSCTCKISVLLTTNTVQRNFAYKEEYHSDKVVVNDVKTLKLL